MSGEFGPGLTLLATVAWHGAPVPGARVQDLLAALAREHPRAVGDQRLAVEVWGLDDAPANPVKALQVLVSRARTHTAGGVVVRTGHGYRLAEPDVDVLSMRAHAAAARAALDAGAPAVARDEARAALAVPMPVAGEPAGADSGPLAALRAEARAEAARSREVLGRALSATSEHAEALALLEEAVAARPGDERLLEALLRSEAGVRGAPAALERYEWHRAHVRDALGTDPGPAMQRLHAELLVRDQPVRQGLLHDTTRLIGRDEDVAALSAMVRTARVASIVGAGGLGKTRLAHVVGRLADQPVVHFVELAGVTSPDGVAVEVGSVLGVRESVTARRLHTAGQRHDLHRRILEQVGAAPTLLVLDNCEHLVEAVAELVAVLVARAPMLQVLTTSRAPLGLAAERVYPLPQLGHADAAALFRERATAARPGVRLDDERVGALVDRLDGLPLALELAAAKVRVMSVEEIERRLENRFALLRGGSRDAPERHQTLLAVIDWSWNLLAEDERVALRRLSVFRDGFSLDCAAALVGGDDTLSVVTRLVDQSLVDVHEGDTVRYRLLETVREFGRMQLVDAGDDAEAESRLRCWASRLAVDALEWLFTARQAATMREVRVEEGNLTDVLRRALADHDTETVLRVMALLSGFWTVSGDHLKVVNVAAPVEALLVPRDVPAGLEDFLRGVLLAVATNTLIFTGSASTAAVERLREIGPGTTRRLAGWTRVLLGVSDTDPQAASAALDRLCADPDPAVAMLALQWASQIRENSGDLDGALEAAEAALARCDDAEGPWQRALLTSQLAGLAAQVGDFAGARGYVEAALRPMEDLGAVEDATQLRGMLAICEMREGRLEDAAELLDRLALEDRTESVFGSRMVVLCGKAELALVRGEVDAGLALYRQAVRALSETAAVPGVEIERGLEPWVIWPQSAAVAAHARHDPSQAVWLHDDLLAKAARGLRETTVLLDLPVAGAVAFALGFWELARPDLDRAGSESAVRLIALADRFAYNRVLPSLDWAPAAARAEQIRPGLLEALRAGYAAQPVDEVRPAVGALLGELAGG